MAINGWRTWFTYSVSPALAIVSGVDLLLTGDLHRATYVLVAAVLAKPVTWRSRDISGRTL